jgi:hypothetical protein
MEVTEEQLRERYNSFATAELAQLYQAGSLSELAVNVLKEVITSRSMSWDAFTAFSESTADDSVTEQGLNIARTVSESFAYLREHFFPLAGLLLQYFLLLMVFAALLNFIFGSENAVELEAIRSIMALIVWPPIAIACHRSILLQQPVDPKNFFPELLSSRARVFIRYLIILLAVYVAVEVLTMGFLYIVTDGGDGESRPDPLFAYLPTIMSWAVLAVAFRFVLIFPAIAVDEFRSLMACQKIMQGTMLRTFWSLVLAVVPIQIATRIFTTAVFSRYSVIAEILEMIVTGFAAILGVAVISFSYTYARNRGAVSIS